ncbi:hypothetical protein QBC44DRAFT_106769 [Cladorrhinum sp. PSN332]|nr:hypothetical protein QBC44DRAFT_106769 [Cladorrhinum sp. PSN332]
MRLRAKNRRKRFLSFRVCTELVPRITRHDGCSVPYLMGVCPQPEQDGLGAANRNPPGLPPSTSLLGRPVARGTFVCAALEDLTSRFLQICCLSLPRIPRHDRYGDGLRPSALQPPPWPCLLCPHGRSGGKAVHLTAEQPSRSRAIIVVLTAMLPMDVSRVPASPSRSPSTRQGGLESLENLTTKGTCTALTRRLLVHPRDCQGTDSSRKARTNSSPPPPQRIQCDLSEVLAQQPCRWPPAGWPKRRDQEEQRCPTTAGNGIQQLKRGACCLQPIPVSLRSFPIRLVLTNSIFSRDRDAHPCLTSYPRTHGAFGPCRSHTPPPSSVSQSVVRR